MQHIFIILNDYVSEQQLAAATDLNAMDETQRLYLPFLYANIFILGVGISLIVPVT